MYLRSPCIFLFQAQLIRVNHVNGLLPAAARGGLCEPAARPEGCCGDAEESDEFSLCSASTDSAAPAHRPTAALSESASVSLSHSRKEDGN